ncbi:MAG: phosphonoacetaldehyde hydrolase [Clostridiales Family XIII bacterium]|jgi:phosphonoacetaldehyde hydrolase|nr:phosphonoacetaldehyde hydrolase [Clostridiales Family XIII bacterium]
MSEKIKAVILDWAGTSVDFGSFAPVAAFKGAFENAGLSPSDGLIRRFMGLPKKDHIRNMLHTDELSAKFQSAHGRSPGEADVEAVYANFEPALFEVLTKYADPLPNVPETVRRIRESGARIGSTTGYTRAMMEVLLPVAAAAGYEPDCLVCPDDVGGAGRPFPYMLWENLRRLGVESIADVVKIGDTAADIAEGKNAGCVSVGVLYGSNMLGLTRESYEALSVEEQIKHRDRAAAAYRDAGADYIIERFADIPALLERVLG